MTLAELIQLNRDGIRLPASSGDTRTFQQFDPNAIKAQRQLRPAWETLTDPINATIGGDRAAQGRVLANVQQAVTDPMMIGSIGSAARNLTSAEARAMVLGRTEKPYGVDPSKFIIDGAEYQLKDIPINKFEWETAADGAASGAYDSTVNMQRAAEYAQRGGAAPPIIAGNGPRMDNGMFSVIDGGHRITAARMRGDETINALVRMRNNGLLSQ